ncbi:MAG: dependent oxidoreductase [Herbaspirillum sp.]|nr:dependent oxidoreductase [Herbaspirillum sp.]
MQTDFDAIIVGAGPAGSSAAILLALAGWSVALVEKQCFPRRKVCGECIAASNMPLLAALGIGSAFDAAAGAELRTVIFMHGERQFEGDLPAALHEKYRWGKALGRETLDTLLLERARSLGVQVLQPWAVESINGVAGDWRFAIRETDSQVSMNLRAAVAIAAYGSWEPQPAGHPRQRAQRPHRKGSDLLAFKANFRHANLADGVLPILSFDGGYGGMVAADKGLTTVACCVRRDRLEASRRTSPGLRAGDVVESMLKRACAGARIALQAASREGAWLAAGPLAPGIRCRADDDMFYIGNAAGEAHPIIGEGMSMALQSAWLLCALLIDREQREKIPDQTRQRQAARSYAAQWRHHFASRLRLAAAFANLAMRPMPAALFGKVGAAWPSLLTLGAQWGGKARCAVDPATVEFLVPGMSSFSE